MQAFDYAAPRTKEEAVALLAERPGEALALAGGTDLLSLMKDHCLAPRRLVDLKGVAELRGLSFDAASGLRIGALTTLSELTAEGSLHQYYPALLHAAQGVHSPQIQNQGTVGGDLLQRPRCWYYRNGFGLLARKDGASMVPAGDNRYHAILGNGGPAYYVHASSFAPALIALGASVRLFGPKGERKVALESFFRTPKQDADPLWDLAADELLLDIQVPPAAGPNATYEVRQREALDWPLAAAAVAVTTDSGSRLTAARVVLGHVAPVPWRASEAESALTGKTVDPAAAQAAGEAAVVAARPLSRNAYKIRLARVAVQRAVLRAFGTEV